MPGYTSDIRGQTGAISLDASMERPVFRTQLVNTILEWRQTRDVQHLSLWALQVSSPLEARTPVFGDRGHSHCTRRTSKERTNPPFVRAAIADAAFVRRRGAPVVAARQKSPIRSFAGVNSARTEIDLSPRPSQTIEVRTNRTLAAGERASALGISA